MKAAAGAPENSFVIPAAGWANWRPSTLDICEICPHPYSVHNIYCSECEKTKTGIEHEFMVRVVPKALIDADSKAQAERDKRLADELKQHSEKLNRYGYVLFAEKLSTQEKEWISNAFSDVAIALTKMAAELSNTQTEPGDSKA